jgi:molecular chaperone GrpE
MSQPAETKEAPGGDGSAKDPKVAELEGQLKEKENKYLYLYAEFENFKKRAAKERLDLLKYGWEGLAHELLEGLDNLERALSHLPPGTDKNLAGGLNMVLGQFKSTLQKQGVQEIASLGQTFDPNLHEAVAHEPSPKPEGTIIQEHHKGYTLHGRLLRPARVTVSAGNSEKKSNQP